MGGKATGGKKTTPKKKSAKKKMVLAGNGKANCAGKGAAIKNEKACRAAANVMKKKIGSSGNFGASFPVGCFVSSANKAVFFNKAKTGKANKGASPVCEGKAEKETREEEDGPGRQWKGQLCRQGCSNQKR